MSVAGVMVAVAAECARTPGRTSIWSKSGQKYVCDRDPEYERAAAEQTGEARPARASISPAFKLVFLTSAGGTLVFVIICIVTTLLAGREPHPALEKMVSALFDMAKIGFGAVTGLLGAQALKTHQ